MSDFDWHAFLRQWSQEVLASPEFSAYLPPEVITSGWLGYPGASEDQILQAEARLETTLPPSYRSFLRASNGWHLASALPSRLLSTEEIEWFAVRHQDWIDTWREVAEQDEPLPPVPDEEYIVYGSGQGTARSFRDEYLPTTLQISDVVSGGSEVYLLNPCIVTGDGEWEAWYFANWIPGAWRSRSFQEMMQDEYKAFVYRKDHNNT